MCDKSLIVNGLTGMLFLESDLFNRRNVCKRIMIEVQVDEYQFARSVVGLMNVVVQLLLLED